MPEKMPDGDVLVHCGDLTKRGSRKELEPVAEWLKNLPHKKKIVIPGNHDVSLDIKNYDELQKKFHPDKPENPVENRKLFEHVTMLYDDSVTYAGLKFYGSAYTPEYMNFSFSLKSEQDSIDCWSKIPDDTDILITHGPPNGILDETVRKDNAGDKILLREIQERVKPKLHCFGHIHEAYGKQVVGETTFINAAMC